MHYIQNIHNDGPNEVKYRENKDRIRKNSIRKNWKVLKVLSFKRYKNTSMIFKRLFWSKEM